MTNRLAHESSPYLLQHAENPVDWYPWGAEALGKAEAEGKPIFLSIGYSACHWCHVMERESFEDESTAELLNRHFVSIKVDREERPDLDAIYMDAVQAMTGHGGWPMSVFLTPAGLPFYGGTYFPNSPRSGLPAFTTVLQQIAEAWKTRREEIVESGSRLAKAIQDTHDAGAGRDLTLIPGALTAAVSRISHSFDARHGGFGSAPKFPQPSVLEFLIRRYVATRDEYTLSIVTATLDAMAKGGIYDQLGGGFHRYSVDAIWLVPHFEKMLYDNAQLVRVYLHAWQVTQDPRYRRVAVETLDYVVREMMDPSGGFYSAQDADSEGEEGRFFVWTPDEIRSVLGDESDLVFDAYGVTAAGNFEGSNIPFEHSDSHDLATRWRESPQEVESRLAAARRALFQARETRIHPARDDKVLSAWNGLMLSAFAEAARVLDRPDYREVAERNAGFLLDAMRDDGGRMLRVWKDGSSKTNGFLEDYAQVAEGLLELYSTTFDPRWFEGARRLCDLILAHFADESGGFFDTSDDHEALIARPKDVFDGAQPSGGSTATVVLSKMAAYTGESRYADAANAALAKVQVSASSNPLGYGQWLSALDFALGPPKEVAIVGHGADALLGAVFETYRPDVVVAYGADDDESTVPLLRDRPAIEGSPTAYVCRQFTCEQPVTEPSDLAKLLDS
jgi:uncharacterized protein YyaL (SSP411 family)